MARRREQGMGDRGASDGEAPNFIDQIMPPVPPVAGVKSFAPASSRKPKAAQSIDDKLGHRERLRERLRIGGADAMPDYEMLELILCRAIPRGDVKPLAKALLRTFETFAEVINAPDERLRELDGVGPRIIEELRLIKFASLRLLKGETVTRDVLSSWQQVIDYIRASQGFDQKEAFRILFLDKRNKLIADEIQQRGTVDHTPVYIREVVKRALDVSATSIILVHNHPSGDPSPSSADITMTKQIVVAAKPLGIVVHDHIIVGRQGHVSMKALGMI
jgi:DNA repair protein RadC